MNVYVVVWRSMESAPKDRWILLKGGNMSDAWYGRDEPPFTSAIWEPCGDSIADDGWACSCWDGDYRTYYENPTHWSEIKFK